MDVVLRRALDRCDCPRCRSLAGQLDALIPTPAHIAAYVAMGAALALTAVFAAGTRDWPGTRLVGMALATATLWALLLLGAMGWAGSRMVQADPLEWRGRGGERWMGWTLVNLGLLVVFAGIQLVTRGPMWLVVAVALLLVAAVVRTRAAEVRRSAACVRDRTG